MSIEKKNKNILTPITTDTLIIGFGFSVIPLLRELELSNQAYTIVSEGNSIWHDLEANGMLDFDLVSSKQTSFYSFELVDQDTKDNYPTAKEYFDFQKCYLNKYRHHVINDKVKTVENFSDYSLVYTVSGTIYRCRHLVIATGFKRKINQSLSNIDFKKIKNKTVVLTSSGDSGTLIMAKLVPNNNKIILLSDGIYMLDKMFAWKVNGKIKSYTLEQMEYHNIQHLSKTLYRNLIDPGLQDGVIFSFTSFPKLLSYFKPISKLLSKLRKVILKDNFYVAHPKASRHIELDFINMRNKSPAYNGLIGIKYWPIDTYETLFNHNLHENIKNGYLLNDLCFFIDQGLIELISKKDVHLAREQQIITYNGKNIHYDLLVEGDIEAPNLPNIVIKGVKDTKYNYCYRENFMGVVPKKLHNIYFVGYTRPFTGGLNNIIEMQCLFIHRMITDSFFHNEIYHEIEEKLKRYNQYHYIERKNEACDHVVYYGFYTEELAKIIGINCRLKDCRSVKEILQYYIFPNNTFKYRQKGPYEVAGVKDIVNKIWREHNGFSGVIHYLIGYIIDILALISLPFAIVDNAWLAIVLVPITLLLLPLVKANHFKFSLYGVDNCIYIIAFGLALYFQHIWIFTLGLPFKWGLTVLLRKFGISRIPFNDMRQKRMKKYAKFFKQYCDAFRECFND